MGPDVMIEHLEQVGMCSLMVVNLEPENVGMMMKRHL